MLLMRMNSPVGCLETSSPHGSGADSCQQRADGERESRVVRASLQLDGGLVSVALAVALLVLLAAPARARIVATDLRLGPAHRLLLLARFPAVVRGGRR